MKVCIRNVKCCYYFSAFHDSELFLKGLGVIPAFQQGTDQSFNTFLKVTNEGLQD